MPARPAALALATLLLAACSSAPAPASRSARPPGASPAATPAPPPPAQTTATATATAACPATPLAAQRLPVLHRGGHPDDLAADGSGGLWVSDTAAGTLVHLTATGTADRTVSGLSSPEGVVPLPGGDLLVAEQAGNRIRTVHPDGSITAYATLPPPPAGVEGIDGIGLDPAGRVLIPDSPHGTLLAAPLDDGAATTRLAGDLGRPVGAAVGPDGAIYVTAENAAPRGLLRIGSGGAVATVGRLRQLDDIVVAGGLLYVTDLADGSVIAVDPAGGGQRTVVTGLGQPQGLAALGDGRLAVADSPAGVIRLLPLC